jgi:hypothetical protein
MTNLINDFLSQPLWLSIPLVMIYLALLAYFLYILWHYRRNTLSAVVLTAALLVGQKATADTPINHGGQSYTLFDTEATIPPRPAARPRQPTPMITSWITSLFLICMANR